MSKETIGLELFEAIEFAQGKAFISDGICDYPAEKVLEIAIRARTWHRSAIHILNSFIEAHQPGNGSGAGAVSERKGE